MPYMFLLLFSLLFTACTSDGKISPSLPSELPSTEQSTDIDDLKIAPENTIVGKYRLKRGAYSHGKIYQDMDEGYLVIEELDANDYGYYYVTVIKGLAETHSGIFYEKGGEFLQKIIYNDENSPESKVETIDNIKITQKDETLKIVIDSVKKETTIWQKDDGVFEPSEKLKTSLKEAEKEYYDFYKKKCKASKIKCSEHEFTKYE